MHRREVIILPLLFSCVLCAISINDGVYSGVSVGLHDNLLQSECEKIVRSVEKMFLNASYLLSEATSGLSFGVIPVIIPNTWEDCGSYSVNNAEGYMTWDSSTLRIGEVDPLFGHEPWTQQPRGCGLEGDFISMTSVWILSTAYTDKYRGSRFVHEWAKYRWGVFEEYGHYGDEVFPESFRLYSGSWSPNYCTDENLNGGFQSSCSDSLDCVFVIEDSPDVTSSLMAVPDPELTSVTHFCNSSTHKVDLPTKQNLLCNYLSTWDVIMNHPDLSKKMKTGRTSVEGRAPEIIVLRENDANSMIIAFETSSTMDEVINRFSFEKESIAQFLVYEAPSSAEVGIVSFGASAIQLFSLTSLQDDGSRNNIAEKVLSTPVSSDSDVVDLMSPIETSAEMLAAGNGIILLITKCTGEEISYTAEELATAADGHPVWMILYPTADTTYQNLAIFNELAMMTGGKVVVVKDELVQEVLNKYISPNVRLALSQAFRQFLHSNPTFDVQQLNYATCEKNESPCTKEFVIPQGFEKEVILYLYKDNGDKIDEQTSSIVVQGGYCGPMQQFGDSKENVETTEVVICNASGGSILTVEVERERGAVILLIELAGRPVYEESEFELRFFGSSDLYDLQYTEVTAPVFFVQILYTDVRVLFANISAVVSFDTTRESSYDTIYLRDDGTGADITGNDGIYSVYLVPAIPVGPFSISITADDNAGAARLTPTDFDSANAYTCCGSIIPLPDSDSLETVPAFSSSVSVINAAITDSPSGLNLPPGIIKDLRYVQEDSQVISISFTATGEDLDYGTADHYDVKKIVGDDSDGEETTLSHTPLPSGSAENIILENVECDAKTTILINAVDGSGVRGGDSNRIIVYLPCVEENGGLTAGAITGIVIACIVLFIIIIILIVVAYRQKYSEDEREKHMKLNTCPCCSDDSDGEFYNTFPFENKDNRPPVQKIRTIEDLGLNLEDHDLPANNQSPNHDPRNFFNQTEFNESSQGDSWDRKDATDPDDGFQTSSFQFSHFPKTHDSVSSLNSRSESPYLSQHSINQIGIPVNNSPHSYSERTTLALDSQSVSSSKQHTPKQYRHNTQV